MRCVLVAAVCAVLAGGCAGGVSVRPGVVAEKSVITPDGTQTERTFYGAQALEVTGPQAAPPGVQREVDRAAAEVRQNSKAASESLRTGVWVVVALAAVVSVFGVLRMTRRS